MAKLVFQAILNRKCERGIKKKAIRKMRVSDRMRKWDSRREATRCEWMRGKRNCNTLILLFHHEKKISRAERWRETFQVTEIRKAERFGVQQLYDPMQINVWMMVTPLERNHMGLG